MNTLALKPDTLARFQAMGLVKQAPVVAPEVKVKGVRPDVNREMFDPDCPCCQRRRRSVSKRMALYYARIKADPKQYKRLLKRQSAWNRKHRNSK